MSELTRRQVESYLHAMTMPYWIDNRSIHGTDVLAYIEKLESRLLTLATAVADHLEGKPIKPPGDTIP